MTTTMTKATITYQIEKGQWGEAFFFVRGEIISSMLKVSLLRNDPETIRRMDSWIGHNMWRWLGIKVDRLPRGITVDDLITAVLVARDEVADAGDCVLPETIKN
jgi:hypothetical protein